MRKPLLGSLILSSLVATPLAQAQGVSFYALIDGGVANSRISGAGAPNPSSKTEFVTGGYAPNFAGMKFEKAVSGGLTAGVQLEQGFLLTPNPNGGDRWAFGNSNLLNRQANIYIKSGAGQFVVGTQPNIAFNNVLMGDPRSGSNYGSSLAMIDIAGSLNTVDDASISYASPALGGFKLAAQYVPESKSANGDIKTGTRASVTWSEGPASVGWANYSSDIIGQTRRNTGNILSGNYKLGAFTLKGIYADQKTATYTATLGTQGLGGAYALNPDTTLDLGYYTSKSDIGGLKTVTLAAGVQYKLTKELTLYGQYAKVDNDSKTATAPFNFTWVTVFPGGLNAGQSASTINVGLLYAFF